MVRVDPIVLEIFAFIGCMILISGLTFVLAFFFAVMIEEVWHYKHGSYDPTNFKLNDEKQKVVIRNIMIGFLIVVMALFGSVILICGGQ